MLVSHRVNFGIDKKITTQSHGLLQQRGERKAPVKAFLNLQFTRNQTAKKNLSKILEIIASKDATEQATISEIKSLFDEIENIPGNEGTEKSISGTWKLVWTTEKVL